MDANLTNPKTLKIIDAVIFSFVIIFLASLTTSIFLNQLGYYGALVFILVKYFLSKKNPFEKTGLEIPILLFIAAEVFSTIFSLNQPQAFQNLLKRVLLIPILYTIISASVDIKKAKIFFKTYIGFALLSCLIYIYMSLDYWIYNQFAVTQSGPSVFNFPITAGELISFTIIFLFAFIINEKGNVKYRLFNIAAFGVACLALISTYKRTGWIGTAAGILAILIMKKQWKLIGLGAAAVIVLFMLEKNVSNYSIYSKNGAELEQVESLKTEGKAYDVTSVDSLNVISDYDNGLLLYRNDIFIKRLETPGAVVKFEKWKDNYFVANLTDSRFILYKQTGIDNFQIVDEFISPGYVNGFEIANNYLYVNDSDSGLTVFKDSENLLDSVRIPALNKIDKIKVDSLRYFTYSNSNGIKIYNLENAVPADLIYEYHSLSDVSTVDFINNKIFISDKSGSKIFNYLEDSLNIISVNEELKNIYLIEENDDSYLMSGFDKNIYKVVIDSSGIMNIDVQISTTALASGLTEENENLFAAILKEGRLASIFDPNKPSNFVRFALWRAGWLIFKDHPLFGVGDIDLAFLYKKYKRDYDKEIQGHLHNNYLHLLAILGGFGFIVVMFLFVKIFLVNLKIYNSLKSEPFLSSYSLGVIGSFVSFLVAGLTEWNFGDHEIITMVWFVVGLNLAFYKLSKSENTTAS